MTESVLKLYVILILFQYAIPERLVNIRSVHELHVADRFFCFFKQCFSDVNEN